jgi:hypothetical protein
LNGFKYMFGEGGIRIPMVISFPSKIKQKRTVNNMVSGMDILPTIMEIVGGRIPEDIDGRSLLPAIENNINIHKELVWSNGRDSWVVRKGKWKLAHNIGWVHNTYLLEGGVAKPADEQFQYPDGTLLFDLENDIGETINLADKHPEIIQELKEIYNEWRLEMSDPRTGDGELKNQSGKGKNVGNSLIKLGAEVSTDGAETNNYNSLVVDGFDKTYWKSIGGDQHTPFPHFVATKFGSKQTFSTIKYISAPKEILGRISEYNIYVSDDGVNWGVPVKSGILPNTDELVKIGLGRKFTTRYIKIEALKTHGDVPVVAISEIDIE